MPRIADSNLSVSSTYPLVVSRNRNPSDPFSCEDHKYTDALALPFSRINRKVERYPPRGNSGNLLITNGTAGRDFRCPAPILWTVTTDPLMAPFLQKANQSGTQ